MLWVVFALLPPFLWGINGVLNKILLDKIVKNSYSFYILTFFIHIPFVLVLAFMFNPVFDFIALSIISGVIGNLSYLAIIFAFQKEDASKVIPLSNLSVIFTLILAFIFLGEQFTFSKYFGIALLFSGAFILSQKKNKGKIYMSPALIFIILNALFFSMTTIIDKYILEHIDFWSRYLWGEVGGIAIACLLMLSKGIRKDFFETLKIKKKYYAITQVNNFIGMGGLVSLFVALSLGPATLVSAIGATCPLMTLALTVLMSIFFPHILKEEINRKNIAIKVFSIALIVIGSVITVL